MIRNLLKNVQNANYLYKLWQRNDVLVLAVSGGSDSMCLLDIFIKLQKKYNLKLIVSHVNYGLRDDSEFEQKMIEDYLRDKDVELEILRVDKRNNGRNENEWREIRYGFFYEIKDKYNANSIVIAHNKNDQVETFLLNLIRGTGLLGLSAMSYKNRQSVIRPLLGIKKDDIVNYCKKYNVPYNDDYTNFTNKYKRNKIRLELIPELVKYNPKIVDAIFNTTLLLGDDYKELNHCLSRSDNIWFFRDNMVECSRDAFLRFSTSRQRIELRNVIKKISSSNYGESFGIIEECRKLIKSNKNKLKSMYVGDLKLIQKDGKVKFILE